MTNTPESPRVFWIEMQGEWVVATYIEEPTSKLVPENRRYHVVERSYADRLAAQLDRATTDLVNREARLHETYVERDALAAHLAEQEKTIHLQNREMDQLKAELAELTAKYEGLGADYEKQYADYTNLLNDGTNLYLRKQADQLRSACEMLRQALVLYSSFRHHGAQTVWEFGDEGMQELGTTAREALANYERIKNQLAGEK